MVIDGNKIFKLVDTFGLPLDIIILILREKNLAFNVAQFIESAKNAKWTKERVYNMLLYSGNCLNNENFKNILNLYINYYFK